MSRKDTLSAIEKVMPHIDEMYNPILDGCNRRIKGTKCADEASTRVHIIDPILKSLGWDLESPKECKREYKVEKGFVDYVCLGSSHRPVLAVEAKKLQWPADAESAWKQMQKYVGTKTLSSIPLAVLTNGKVWRIYRQIAASEWRLLSVVDLWEEGCIFVHGGQGREDAADMLNLYLSKKSLFNRKFPVFEES